MARPPSDVSSPTGPLAEDLPLLLGLALAAGGAVDDLDAGCREVLRRLVDAGRAEIAAIWRVEESPRRLRGGNASFETTWRASVVPREAEPNAAVSNWYRILPQTKISEPFVAPAETASFRLPATGAGGDPPVVLVLPLAQLGVLELLRRDAAGAEADLEALRPVADHLAAALRGGLANAALRAVEVQDEAAAAAERERLRHELAGELRHALRNSLTGLMGFSELLTRREYPPHKRRDLLALLHREAERILELLGGRGRAAG